MRIEPCLKRTGLTVEYPFIDNSPYDLLLGGTKIQAKTSRLNNYDTGLVIALECKIDGEKGAYSADAFHILLVNNPPPFDNTFYFVPQLALLKHDVLKTEDEEGKVNILLYPKIDKDTIRIDKILWPNEFLCYYNDPNLTQRLLFIRNMQLNNQLVSIVLSNPIVWEFKCKTLDDHILKWGMPKMYAKKSPHYHYELFGKKILERKINNDYCIYLFYELKRRIKTPFSKSSFDHVYSVLPPPYNHMCVILPMKELIERKIISDNSEESQKFVKIPNINNKYRKKGKNEWIVKYIFDMTAEISFRDAVYRLIKD